MSDTEILTTESVEAVEVTDLTPAEPEKPPFRLPMIGESVSYVPHPYEVNVLGLSHLVCQVAAVEGDLIAKLTYGPLVIGNRMRDDDRGVGHWYFDE